MAEWADGRLVKTDETLLGTYSSGVGVMCLMTEIVMDTVHNDPSGVMVVVFCKTCLFDVTVHTAFSKSLGTARLLDLPQLDLREKVDGWLMYLVDRSHKY